MTSTADENRDPHTVAGFGSEWKRFDFDGHDPRELDALFAQYFSLVDWSKLPPNACAFDAGCGSGRWAKLVAPRVAELHCVDAAADALEVARRNTAALPNVHLHLASVSAMPIAEASMDFGYSLGVLHHVPDTLGALKACASKLKPGAPFLVYLYYALENRTPAFRALWRASDLVRRGMSRLPFRARAAVAEAMAAGVYWPLARTALLAEQLGASVERLPLSYYRSRSFYVMRNDALDRFGTRLEQRFTQAQIREMLTEAGFENISFRDDVPYWCALGHRKG